MEASGKGQSGPSKEPDQLERWSQVDVRTVDTDSLIDIREVSLDKDKRQKDRLLDFIRQIGNPYCFKYGELVVKISFTGTKITLDERLEEYLKRSCETHL